MVRKVGIVGSSESYWSETLKIKAKEKIKDIFVSEVTAEIEKVINELFKSEEYKKTLFYDPYSHFNRIMLVSGASPKKGVDEFAEIVADDLGVKKEIYPAEVNRWNDKHIAEASYPLKGYKSRNIQIATVADVLYCIDPITRKQDEGGGMWTLRYAKRLNKETHHIIIDLKVLK